MKISILISTYNGKDDLPLLLDSIANQILGSHELEVILRDDNSTDGTVDLISKNYPWVKLIQGSQNFGFAKSNNIAMKHSTGDVICCVNQDTILDSDFVIEGLAIMEKHPEITGINTNMIMPWVLPLDSFRTISRDIFPAYEYQLTPYGFTKYVKVESVARKTNFISGGGFFLRSSALMEEEELFDSRIHMYCEDTELSLRLLKRGGKLIYTPKCILYHNQVPKKAGTLKELKKLIMITWTRFHVLYRHFSPSRFFRGYPLYVWGIVRKMDFLGLERSKKPLAYFSGGCLAVIFIALLPYWIFRSFSYPKDQTMSKKFKG